MSGTRLAAAAALLIAALAAAQPLAAAAPQATGQAAQAEGDSDAADVIVLLDTSQSALPYFQDVTDYVVTSVVERYLRSGDTFHLLSFGETTQVEIAQRVVAEADVKTVLGKLYLLYPLARYTDLVGALGYLYQYMADLPLSRRKVVVIITDGVHNPPPSSSTFGQKPEEVQAEIDAAAARIRANGWPVHIIKLPFPKPGERGAPAAGSAESKGTSYLDSTAKALAAEVSDFTNGDKADIALKSLALPSAEFPGSLGKQDYSLSFPLKLTNGSDSTVGLELDRVRTGETDILAKKAFLTLQSGRSGTMDIALLLPDTLPAGETKLPIRVHFANGVRISPDTAVLELTLVRSPVAALLRSSARIVLFAVILILSLAAILGIVIMVRRLPKGAEIPVAAAVRSSEEARKAAKQPLEPGLAASAQAGAATATAATASTAQAAAASASAQAPAATAASTKTRPSPALPEADPAARALAEFSAAASAQRGDAGLPLKSAALPAQAPAKAMPASQAPAAAAARVQNEHEAEIAREGEKLAALKQAEIERSAAILEAASGRRRPAAAPAGRDRAASASWTPRVLRPGTILIELQVAEQNPHIGTRNVHSLSAGGSKSVGGGMSDFLVFLVSVPRRSAELHFDGEKLSFVPLRAELFPELKGPIEDCLGRDIPMISRSGYPLVLRFAVYERPVDKINKLLHCIDTTGL